MSRTVATAAQFSDYLINGYWSATGASARRWGAAGSSPTVTWTTSGSWTSGQRAAITTAMRTWSDVANIRFNYTTSSAQITLRTDTGNFYAYSQSSTSGSQITSNSIVFNATQYDLNALATPGAYENMALIHELGHTIGLGHPGPYNGSGEYATDAIFTNDTRQYSLMSYWDAGSDNNTTPHGNNFARTPLLYDIYAAQRIYGANTSIRNTDTVYGFHSTADAAEWDFSSQSGARIVCLWDGGGNDTLDVSGYSQTARIDLNQGDQHFSSVGGLTNNLSIAYGCSIENAVGGTGGDTIYGNDLANVLTGGGGNDAIDGGSGNDIAVFSGARSNYTISDLGNGVYTVADNRSNSPDGTDRLTNIEQMRFSNGTFSVSDTGGGSSDETAPTLVSTSPSDNSANVAIDANLSLTFSENVRAGYGNIVITNQTTGRVLETISVTDTARVNFSGTTVTINPNANLVNNNAYSVAIDNSAIWDAAGNRYAGFTDNTTFNFTTISTVSRNDRGANSFSAAGSSPSTSNLGALLTASQTSNAITPIDDAVGGNDRHDYYKFTLGRRANVSLGLTNLTADADVEILNASGSRLSISQNWDTADEAITLNNLAAGAYYVHVYQYSGNTNYHMSLSAAAAAASTNHAPVLTAASASNRTVAARQNTLAQNLFNISDADHDAITQYQFLDNTPTSTSGYFEVYNSSTSTWEAQTAADISSVLTEDLSTVRWVGGTTAGQDTVYVRAYDGQDWSSNLTLTLSTSAAPNRTPIVTVANPGRWTIASGAQITIGGSTYFSARDPDANDRITQYQFWDGVSDATSGYITVDGVQQNAVSNITVDAAALSTVGFTGGSATSADNIWVRASDGNNWGEWRSFTINTSLPNRAPVVTARDRSYAVNTFVSAGSLFSATDPDGNIITRYRVRDNTIDIDSGDWQLNSVTQASGQIIEVTAAQLQQLRFATSAMSGSDELQVAAYDGSTWSDWSTFTLTSTNTSVTLDNALVNGLGGSADFGEGVLESNDDGSTNAVDLTSIFGSSGLNFYGTRFTSVYVNNNGNITFGSPLSSYTPGRITGSSNNPIIAPFWADVDTRSGSHTPTQGGNSTGSNQVYYDIDAADGIFTVTWDDVGYYSYGVDALNAFQLQLINRGNGDFDIVFRYEDINWNAGTASGGNDGGVWNANNGGSAARAGWNAGGNRWYEVQGSGSNDILNIDTQSNVGVNGLFQWAVRAGTISQSLPQLNIEDTSGAEGGSAMFTVRLSRAVDKAVSFHISTTDGTADSSRYVPIADKTYTIAAGQTSIEIPVSLRYNMVAEGQQTFSAIISRANNATIGRATAVATVDDQNNRLVRGLGGNADYGENVLEPGDDGSSDRIDVRSIFGNSGLNFFGHRYTSLYVNINGSITFNSPLSSYTPSALDNASFPIIAPFWADVDTRGEAGGTNNKIYYDLDAANGTFTATWNTVGFYDRNNAPTNSFQVQLINRNNGDFDIVYRYADINWDSGEASGGDSSGLGGTAARAGYAVGDGSHVIELTGSGDESSMLALEDSTGNTGATGVYMYAVRNSAEAPVISIADAEAYEGGGPLMYRVSLSHTFASAVTFRLSTETWTATAGSDFTPAPSTSTYTIAAGSSYIDVPVRVTLDSLTEGNEYIYTRLVGVNGAAIGDSTATGTIYDSTRVGAVSNVARGADNSDRLIASRGATLTGNGGVDFFYFSANNTFGADIADFTSGTDKIALLSSSFNFPRQPLGALNSSLFTCNTTGTADNATTRLIYNNNNHTLYYDADGSARASSPVAVARFTNNAAIAASDIILVS
ncbi:hypothetical protein CCP2SC5_70048 [Azospirillaceae bacterium]